MPESDFMKAFKVANFTIVEQPVQGAPPLTAAEPVSSASRREQMHNVGGICPAHALLVG